MFRRYKIYALSCWHEPSPQIRKKPRTNEPVNTVLADKLESEMLFIACPGIPCYYIIQFDDLKNGKKGIIICTRALLYIAYILFKNICPYAYYIIYDLSKQRSLISESSLHFRSFSYPHSFFSILNDTMNMRSI